MNGLLEVKTGFSRVTNDDFKKLTPRLAAGNLREARGLRGKTVIHINATPVGGGVVEILRGQIPIERSLGIRSRWLVIKAVPEFFGVTKHIHNLLQGQPGRLSRREEQLYINVNRDLGLAFRSFLKKNRIKEALVVVHDPQPLPLVGFIPPGLSRLLRLHIDLSTANPVMLDFLRPLIERYGLVVVSSRNYLDSFGWLGKSSVKVIQPAIDPLCEKNRPMTMEAAWNILAKFGLDADRPVLTQVSRFDPWKDPLGVIRAYRQAKRTVPGLQLVLAGFITAKDDPEAVIVLKKVKRLAGADKDIFLFFEPGQLGRLTNDRFINALLTASTVVVQNSVREGFGLTMTEAMWHAKPLIAGRTAGALLQIANGRNGLIIASPRQLTAAIVRLLRDGRIRARLGRAARASVLRRYVLPKYVLDNLKLYNRAAGR